MKIFALTKFNSKALLKQKATQLMSLLTVIFIVISWLVSDINIATKYKLFEDVLLTSQMVLLHVSALFYAFEYLQNERISGLYVLPLSTGLSRFHYLLSVFLTIGSIGVFFLFILFFIDIFVLWFLTGDVHINILWQLVLYFFSSQLLAALVIMFSQYVSVMNSLIYTMTLYFLGNALDELYYYAFFWKKDTLLQNIYEVLIYIVPNFSIFDKQGIVVNRAIYSLSELYFEPFAYIVISMIIIFNITYFRFKNKALRLGE